MTILNEPSPASSISGDDLMQKRLLERQLDFFVSNSRVSIAASVFNASIFLAVLRDLLPGPELILWYAAVLAFSLPRLFLMFVFGKVRTRFSLRFWKWLMACGTMMTGIIWGLTAPLFFVHLPPLGQAFHILLLGGTLTGAAIYLAHLLPCFVSFAIPHATPMLFVLLGLSADRFSMSMALLLFIFTVMMFIMAFRTNRQFATFTLLQVRNDALMEKLNESEYLFRMLTEHSTAGVVLISDDRFLYVNPAVEAITGYTVKELVNSSCWDIVDPEHRDMVRERTARRLKAGGAVVAHERLEFRTRRKDGALRWIEYTPTVLDYQGRKVTLGVCSDITDRLLARRALQEGRERYRALFETASDAMYVVGLDGKGIPDLFFDANVQACASLGYSRPEMLRLGLRDITHLYELKYVKDLRDRLQSGGQAVYEANHVASDGRFIPVEVSAKLFTHEGERAVLCIARDVSERKEAQQRLKAAKMQAETANQAKSEFLANMSHEIRTPLNGLLGMLQLVRMGDLDAERSQYLDVAMNSGESLLAIINDILDLSKIEAGKFELAPTVFDLHALVRSVAETFSFPARSKGVRMEVEIDEGMPPLIRADQVRLRQILYNLVGNAVKFTHEGEIRIALALLGRQNGLALMEFRVSDTGIGIPKDQQAGLFQPFVQAAATGSARGSGTGLGLSIVKRIAGFMGGDVELSSDLGQGTTVAVRVEVELGGDLPREDPDCASRQTCCLLPQGGLRILVAEDNSVNQLMIVKLLEKLGHRAVCVQDGTEALEILRRKSFDCVLMDIQMPGLDGTEVTRLIRRQAHPEIDPRIPIIALTAYALSGDREKFLAQGMTAYLSKPVSMADLSAVLCEVVPRADRASAPGEGDRA
jgi:PAS domain S-box-containing protein